MPGALGCFLKGFTKIDLVPTYMTGEKGQVEAIAHYLIPHLRDDSGNIIIGVRMLETLVAFMSQPMLWEETGLATLARILKNTDTKTVSAIY